MNQRKGHKAGPPDVGKAETKALPDRPMKIEDKVRDKIGALIKRSRMLVALEHIDDALKTDPADAQVLLQRGKVLRHLNRLPESKAVLQALLEAAPTDPEIICELAVTARRSGDAAESLALVTPVLDSNPSFEAARLEQIEALLAQGDPDTAVAAAAAAARMAPENLALRLAQARALQSAGQGQAAVEVLRDLHAKRPRNTDVSAALAQALHHSGAFAQAEQVYARLTKSTPKSVRAWAGRIGLALERDRIEEAKQICNAGLAHNHDNRSLVLLKCKVLQALHKPEAAVTLIKGALGRKPADEVLRARLVQMLYQIGDPDAAAQVSDSAPSGGRESAAILIARLNVAETQGETEQAFADVTHYLGLSENGLGSRPIPIDVGLKYCELALQANETKHVEAVIGHLLEKNPQMQDAHLVRLFKLGERINHLDAPLRVIREVAGRHQIRPVLAEFLMRRGQLVMAPDAAMGLAQALQSRLRPRVQPEFAVFATSLISGPDAALRLARKNSKGPATLAQAAALGQQISSAGQFPLALRYLRFCMRRWPNDRQLRHLFLRACSDVGDLTEGHKWLDRLKAENPQMDVDRDRVGLLVLGARLEEALAICEERQARGLKTRAPSQVLELYLALGRYEEAEEMARILRGSPGVGRQTAGHFGGTLLGGRLKELALYRQEAALLAATGLAEDEIDRKLATSLFYPAKRIIDAWLAAAPAVPNAADAAPSIPRSVVQYWNTATPPDEVSNLMQSWQQDGIAHKVYDRIAALAFLRSHFGEKHVRAFVLANSVTEECDFLRLCLLFKLGGVYADADDRLIKPIDNLLAQGTGMIVMREMMGAISNNIICARAGHPVLKIAIALAGQSLLRRESDSTWTKTGPGLLSRAIAIYLHDTPEEESRRDLTILSSETLNRFIQSHVHLSYKSTSGYWNAKDGRVPGPIVSALMDLAEATTDDQAGATG